MEQLSIVTSNVHKYEEMKEKMTAVPINLHHISLKYPEIQADTIKQVLLASLTNLIPLIKGNFIIEDAGLEIKALNNFPGPYSSFVYTTIGWEGILKLMNGINEREANFKSVVGLSYKDEIYYFVGRCEGEISLVGKGSQGFGFDPIFIPYNYNKTLAQLDMPSKNSISHRGKSTELLIDFLLNSL